MKEKTKMNTIEERKERGERDSYKRVKPVSLPRCEGIVPVSSLSRKLLYDDDDQ
jgi:hypothetical protein